MISILRAQMFCKNKINEIYLYSKCEKNIIIIIGGMYLYDTTQGGVF